MLLLLLLLLLCCILWMAAGCVKVGGWKRKLYFNAVPPFSARQKIKIFHLNRFWKANKKEEKERKVEEMNKKCIIIFSTALNFAIKFPFFCCVVVVIVIACSCIGTTIYNKIKHKAYWEICTNSQHKSHCVSLIIDLFAVCVARRWFPFNSRTRCSLLDVCCWLLYSSLILLLFFLLVNKKWMFNFIIAFNDLKFIVSFDFNADLYGIIIALKSFSFPCWFVFLNFILFLATRELSCNRENGINL